MVTPLFEFFEKLIEQFTWKRLLFTFCVIIFTFFCFVIYESYTGHFKLNRLEKTVALIKKSSELPGNITKASETSLSNAFKSVAKDIESFANHETTAFSIDKDILKSMAAFLPWLFMLLITPLLSKNENYKSVIGGILVLAIPFSVVAAFLPDFENSWINYVLYPIGHFIFLIFVVILFDQRKKAITSQST